MNNTSFIVLYLIGLCLLMSILAEEVKVDKSKIEVCIMLCYLTFLLFITLFITLNI